MSEIAVVGSSKFVLGFQLAGIRQTIEADSGDDLMDVMKNHQFGIVIVEGDLMGKCKEHEKMMIQDSISPVAVVLSENEQSDDLRRMIIKSIGVDLWNK